MLKFDNYSENQERTNRVTDGTIIVYRGGNVSKIPRGKAYHQYLENTEEKLVSMTDLLNTSRKITYAQNWKKMLYVILET